MRDALTTRLPNPKGTTSASPWGYLLALAVFIVAVVVVQVYVRRAERRELETAEIAFADRTDEMAALLRQRLGNYELVDRGGVSLFASVARPSREQWQNYVAGLNLTQRFPALVGLGFAIYVSPGQLSDLQRMLRSGGGGLFTIYPRGPRDHYGAVFYMEPQTRENAAAIGYDMYSEPARHEAMQAALETGEARMSGPVHLVQDSDKPISAVQLYLPVYRAGDRPATRAARRESMQGWVYTPFRINDFVEGALRSTQARAHLRIVDVTGPGEHVLYADPPQSEQPAFKRTLPLGPFDAYGRHWRLEFAS